MEAKKDRVAICIHALNHVDFDVYFNHIYSISHWVQQYDICFATCYGADTATARNQIFDRVLELDAPYAFLMDADHLFPVEALPLLMENKDEAITSGLVCKKGQGFQQVAWGFKDGMWIEAELPLLGDTIEVAACAFGCTLINIEHLRRLKKPWFRDECIPNCHGHLANQRSDIGLCIAFRDIGQRVFVDTRVLVGHRGIPRTVYPQNAELMRRLMEIELDGRRLKDNQKGFYHEP